MYRSSHQRCSIKKGVLRNSTKFTGNHSCQSLFFNKVAGHFVKKETLAQVFSYNFCETSKNTFGRPLLHLTFFAKVSLFLLKSSSIKVLITFRFIIEKLTHIKWDFIIPSSLRLLLKVWIWFRFQNRKFLSPAWWRIISF